MNVLQHWTKSKDSREAALGCLLEILNKGQSLSELQSAINQHDDSAIIREMVFGVCRWYHYLNKESSKHLKKPLKAKDNDLLTIIFLGMYQILFMKTSDHAAVNESVNLVYKVKKKWAKGLVNAILRKFCGQTVSLDSAAHEASFADWMSQLIKDNWSQQAEQVFHYSNEKAPICLRINEKKTTLERFTEKLDEQDISYQLVAELPQGIVLNKSQNITQLPGYESGEFYVQDGSAQMASLLLDVQEGMNVLDACAAPGGKTSHIAEIVPTLQQQNLTALEIEANRIQRLNDNFKRLGHQVNVLCGDAANPDTWFNGQLYDRILVDAPCSASGIIRRHPDIKLLRRESDIADLAATQWSILNALWPLLKQGGELLYCTCSIFKQENEQQIERFIKQHSDCVEINIDAMSWGEKRPRGIQVLPSTFGKDGFYYAKLAKTTVSNA